MKSNRIIASLSTTAVTLSVLAACGPQSLPTATNTNNRAPQGVRAQSVGTANVPGRVAVKYRSGVIGTQSIGIMQSIGAEKVRSIGEASAGIDILKIPAGKNVDQVVKQLSANPAVEYAEPVFTVPFPKVIRSQADDDVSEPSAFPNDPMFARQYSHKVTESQRGWAVTRGNSRVIIGVVDSGVDITHPDLKGKIVGTYNGADGNKDVKDFVGHGTHVAGIAAAMTNNRLGVAGVAPDCGILAIKVASGNSGAPSTEGIANGVRYAADHGARVINLSLGGKRQSMLITDAVKHALSKDIVVVVAMGNDGRKVKNWPAGVPGVIPVGSTDSRNNRSSFSTTGEWISVSAPGSDILSTFPFNQNMIGQKEYGSISGTSMATPFVAGLAGLIRSKYPRMSAPDVKRVLELSSNDFGTPGFDELYGHGRVNVGRALSKAEELLEAAKRR